MGLFVCMLGTKPGLPIPRWQTLGIQITFLSWLRVRGFLQRHFSFFQSIHLTPVIHFLLEIQVYPTNSDSVYLWQRTEFLIFIRYGKCSVILSLNIFMSLSWIPIIYILTHLILSHISRCSAYFFQFFSYHVSTWRLYIDITLNSLLSHSFFPTP